MVYPGENLQDLYFSAKKRKDHVLRTERPWGLGKQRENLISAGWWFEPLWKIWKSIGMIIPNIWEKQTCSKQPTSISIGIFTSYLYRLYSPRWLNYQTKNRSHFARCRDDELNCTPVTISPIARPRRTFVFFLPSVESFDVQNQKDMLGYVGMFNMIFWNMLGFFLDPYLL